MRKLLMGLLAVALLVTRPSSAGGKAGASDPDHAPAPDASDHIPFDLPDDRGHTASSPTDIPSTGWKDIARRTLAQIKDDRVPMMAAAVAFAGLLALFPALIAAISIYGLVVDPSTAAEQATNLAASLPDDAAALIGDQLQSIATAEEAALGTALVISILGALWSASGGTGMLIDAINVAYDEEDERNFARKRGLALLLTLGAIVFVAVTITLIAVVPPLLDSVGLGIVGTIAAQAARWLLLAGLIAVALAVLYRYGPDREDARWAWISPGAILAGTVWLLGSLAFSFFVDNFGSYNETYGTVAGVIVLMLWLQISALIVLVGAELNAEMERQTIRDTTTGPDQPIGHRGAEPADDVPPTAGQTASSSGDPAADRNRVST